MSDRGGEGGEGRSLGNFLIYKLAKSTKRTTEDRGIAKQTQVENTAKKVIVG